MAVFNEPAQWDHTLGNSADASTLPDDSAATAGTASLQKLFQLINATPLEAGGIAPAREDVNALFKYLGDQIFYTQNGGIPSYNADYDYVAGRVVLYNDNLYKCIQANGASSTVVAPDSDTAYWQRLDNYVRSVNGVNADAEGNVELYDYVIESVVNSDGSWYRKWKSGWLEQGGKVYFGSNTTEGAEITVSLLLPFTNSNYSTFLDGLQAYDGALAPLNYVGSQTTTNFSIICKNTTKRLMAWHACGMGA